MQRNNIMKKANLKSKLLSTALATLLILSALLLPSCAKKDNAELRVAVLSGTTGWGAAPLISSVNAGESKLNAKIDIYSDATLVSPLMINGDADIAAVPTNLAAVLYNKTSGGIRVLAVNTLGVLYLIEDGNSVNSLADLAGKTVYLPGQGSNPEFIMRALVEGAGVENVTFDYTYSSPDELATALASGKAALGVLPEPKVTAVISKKDTLRVALDFTEEWKKQTTAPLVQGCIIVRTAFLEEHPAVVEQFLKEYKTSVELVDSDPDSAAEMIAETGLAGAAAAAKAALPRCNITYLTGDEMATALNGFWNALFKLDPKSVGGALPDADITKAAK